MWRPRKRETMWVPLRPVPPTKVIGVMRSASLPGRSSRRYSICSSASLTRRDVRGASVADAIEPGHYLGHVRCVRARVEHGVEVEVWRRFPKKVSERSAGVPGLLGGGLNRAVGVIA